MMTNTQNYTLAERIADFIAPRLKEKRNIAEREANTDALTGLANRAAFEKARVSAEGARGMSFIVFDANNFGLVNKTVGHVYGDRLLFSIGTEVKRACLAHKARAFRLGGDEFVVLVKTKYARAA